MATLLETLLKILFYLIIGSGLLLANVWYLNSIINNFQSKGFVISPFQIVGGGSNGAALGTVLPTMLRAQLARLQGEINATQRDLLAAPVMKGPQKSPTGQELEPLAQVDSESEKLKAVAFEPVDLKISIGGVEVGGILSWLQRQSVKARTLNFIVNLEDNKAVIIGNVEAIKGVPGDSLWLETTKTAPAEIVQLLAYEVIRKKIEKDQARKINDLSYEEFRNIQEIIDEIVKQQKSPYILVSNSSRELLAKIDTLATKFQEWQELSWFAANTYYLFGNHQRALHYYKQVAMMGEQEKSRHPKKQYLVDLANGKIDELKIITGPARDILLLTGYFETGKISPDEIFGAVNVVPSVGLSFGVLQWNLRFNTLEPLLQEMEGNYPEIFKNIFGAQYQELQDILTKDTEMQLTWSKSIKATGIAVTEPWKSHFANLGREPVFQEIQFKAAIPYFQRAMVLMDEYGLKSERGLALFFDNIIHFGSIRPFMKNAILQEFNEFSRQNNREPNELEKLIIISNVVSQSRKFILHRKLKIANGEGPFKFELKDFRTGKQIIIPENLLEEKGRIPS